MAHSAVEVTDLLSVLWARGQAAVGPPVPPPSQLRALQAVARLGSTNLKALGDALGSTPPATSRLCDRLEAAGLVERGPSPSSRREVELSVSRTGQALLEEIRDGQTREMHAVLTAIPPKQLAQLAEGLAAFRDAAEAVVGETGRGAAGVAPRMRMMPPA
ncbi:MarR family winged helix-turn-helix transcriptional regulator [Streptomyces sp. NPDC060194]|uniref:MarR family winged helix-turn-helix transcriptional regulator n=1 Tax=Streptomyces sp. NPDC060194 TaxID=3347069 RepID=UPI00364FD269